jgi:ribosomal protein S18 acetylase RimI-like enzyme
MIGGAQESQLATVRRARLLRRLAPLAALAATGASYGLHHTSPLDGHSFGVVVLFVSAAAGVALVVAAFAATLERRLPIVVTLRPGSTYVRPAQQGDLDFCTALHSEALPHGFFAERGFSFLRAYLATFVSSPHAAAFVATVDGTPVGMVVGVIRPRAHRRWVLKHRGLRLAAVGGAALVVRPRLALRFIRTRLLRYSRALRREQQSTRVVARERQSSVLSHVAVAPGAEGAGLGGRLVDAFVDAARAAGAERVVLATLAGKAGAAGFYRKLGWCESEPAQGFDGQSIVLFSLSLRSAAK